MSDLYATARQLGAATLHEAAGRTGALPSPIKPVHRRWRVAGPAFPVATTPAVNVWIHDAIYEAPEGAILVVSCGDFHEAGYWGDIMSNAAVARKLGGLVIDGGVRDTDDLDAIDFPVFSRGTCIQGTTKERLHGGSVGQPVRMGSVLVSAGDLVVGDADGVFACEAARAEEVVAAGRARADKEETVRERLRAGESTLDIYGLRAG